MYCLVDVDQNSMAVHLTRCDCEGLRKCCISNAVDETDDDMIWNGSEEDRNVRRQCEEVEGTDCEGGESDIDLSR